MTRKEKTLSLIRNTSLSVPEIHRATGLGLSWLQRFKQGDFKSEDKIDALYTYLVRRK